MYIFNYPLTAITNEPYFGVMAVTKCNVHMYRVIDKHERDSIYRKYPLKPYNSLD